MSSPVATHKPCPRGYSDVPVARNLPPRDPRLTMEGSRRSRSSLDGTTEASPTMLFRPKRNRRRIDVAKKTGELKAVAKSHAPLAVRVLASIAVSVGLAWGGWAGWQWASTSPRFALTAVTFTGTVRATDAELAKVGGIVAGANLVAMDVGGIERALAAHPWVKSVRVRRHLPSRLTVEVVEHEPVALLAIGELYLVNQDAEPFKRVKVDDGLDLPLVTGIERDRFLNARAQALVELRRAIDVARAYAATKSAKEHPLSEVHVEPDAVTLVTLAGQEIRFGDGAVEPQLARLERVRRELAARSQRAEVIRLDNRARPEWVTVQLSGGIPERGARAGK